MKRHVAHRANIPPFYVMDVWLAAAERQRTHGDLVNLSAGQPSAGAPRPVRAAAMKALEADQLGYTVALGIPELREAIADSYTDKYGLTVTVDDVVLTTGSSGGFLLTFLACFDAGDRVEFVLIAPGRYEFVAATREVTELKGMFGPATKTVSIEAMSAAIAKRGAAAK